MDVMERPEPEAEGGPPEPAPPGGAAPVEEGRLRRRALAAGIAAAVVGAGWIATGYRYDPVLVPGEATAVDRGAPRDASTPAAVPENAGTVAPRRTPLARRAPRESYIVIDRTNNRLFLRRGDEVRLEAVVSTGSGTVLQEATGRRRTWTFQTPLGRLKILSKRSNPPWVKPDWAFIEEGLPIPTHPSERVERGTLGEFALDLGDGYMIHGTLYERLLGRSVTHGCVRVGRDDLRVLYRSTRVGTPVFVF